MTGGITLHSPAILRYHPGPSAATSYGARFIPTPSDLTSRRITKPWRTQRGYQPRMVKPRFIHSGGTRYPPNSDIIHWYPPIEKTAVNGVYESRVDIVKGSILRIACL